MLPVCAGCRYFMVRAPGVRQLEAALSSSCWSFLDSSVEGKVLEAIQVRKYLEKRLLYYRTCKPDFLCSWPSLNSYLK